MDDLSAYDYHLPEELIARRPLPRRDESRLLVLDREQREIAHAAIHELPSYVRQGDCVVMNNTRVVPARLLGQRTRTGGKWEGLYLETTAEGAWHIIGQCRGRLEPNETLTLQPAHADRAASSTLTLRLIEKLHDGSWTAAPSSNEEPLELLNQFGTVPLPPYIGRQLADDFDWERYQTVYAERPGAVAAPTAGLHLTPELLAQFRSNGATLAEVTLHVGIGTFRPISVTRLSEHQMHAEWCEVPPDTCAAIRRTKECGGRVIAIGTTTVRALESASRGGKLESYCDQTNLFITPGFTFQTVDAMLTNFHLPKSTLYVMVSAFAGLDFIRQAYSAAVENEYRFYSYGDAMLIQ